MESLTLEERVVLLLQENKLTIATAESCTAGMVAARLVNVSGISSLFQEGYITYSNEAKERLLGVSHRTLEKYGAVSRQTAVEMAEGCRNAAGVRLGIAITGIAGPEGGTKEKPVGLVYIGCSMDGQTYVERHIFEGTRNEVRESAATCALMALEKIVLGRYR